MTMSKKEKQEAVEFVCMFMASQKGLAAPGDPGNLCRYKNIDGCRCAIGCMLTDDQCKTADKLMFDIFSIISLGWNGWDMKDHLFLDQLMNAHDTAVHKSKRMAERFNYINAEDEFLTIFGHSIKKLCSNFRIRFPEEIF